MNWKLQNKAILELGENPETRDAEIEKFRKNIVESGLEVPSSMESDFLLAFLRARKFQPERALKLFKNYHKTKVKHPRMTSYHSLTPEEVDRLTTYNIGGGWPHKDKNGCLIYIYRHEPWDPRLLPAEDLMRLLYCAIDFSLDNPEVQINGVVLLADFKGFTFAKMRALVPWALVCINLLQDSFPARLKKIHIINETPFLSAMINMFKAFIPMKILKRIQFYGTNLSKFHGELGLESGSLPNEFGGSAGPYSTQDWMEGLKKQMFIV